MHLCFLNPIKLKCKYDKIKMYNNHANRVACTLIQDLILQQKLSLDFIMTINTNYYFNGTLRIEQKRVLKYLKCPTYSKNCLELFFNARECQEDLLSAQFLVY